MAERPRMTDEELERSLRALGSELDYPPPADLGPSIMSRLATGRERSGWWRRLVPGWLLGGERRTSAWQPLAAAAALVTVLFVGSLLAFPSVRQAVADWLGLRGIGITVVPSLSPIPTQHRSLILGQPVSFEEAQAAVPWRILLPDDPLLGSPDEVYLDRSRVVGGAVSLIWTARPGLPVASTTGAGLLLTEFRAEIDERYFQKIVGPGTTIERADVGDHLGYWVAGAPHELYFVDSRGIVMESVRLAGDVLMWEDGELTLRIESALSKQDAIRIAETLR